MKHMKKLSVIIVSYNGSDILYDCLKSIEKYNDLGEELEVIVSDNSPDTKVVEMVRKNFPTVIAVHNEKNGGFGYGNNRGAEISEGQFLLFLNPDTILIEPIFKYCVEKFETKDERGKNVITGRTRNNKIVHIPYDKDITGSFINTKIVKARTWYLNGEGVELVG